MKHVMIDIETLATTPDAAILSIGACQFSPDTSDIGSTFRVAVDLESAMDGRRVDADTIKWWLMQDRDARARLTQPGRPLPTALADLRYWLDPDAQVWGNGATFDISILEHAYHQHNIRVPWEFWNVRDVRTIVELAAPNVTKDSVEFDGVAHDPLDDAVHQARYVSLMWQYLRGVK